MSSTTIAQVLSENYMAERHPTNGGDGVKFFRVGAMVDADHQRIASMELVIDDVGRGQHWYFCATDNVVFPCNASCPKCGRSVRAEKQPGDVSQDAGVTGHNTPDYR